MFDIKSNECRCLNAYPFIKLEVMLYRDNEVVFYCIHTDTVKPDLSKPV